MVMTLTLGLIGAASVIGQRYDLEMVQTETCNVLDIETLSVDGISSAMKETLLVRTATQSE